MLAFPKNAYLTYNWIDGNEHVSIHQFIWFEESLYAWRNTANEIIEFYFLIVPNL